ncbi:MAG: stage II sporulation protein M, partial [Candidatus Dadabacteria bacterium]
LQPGDLTRKESIQQRAKSIMDLIIFSALALVVAGLIEGFMSPQDIAFEIKLLTGITAGVVYWWLILSGGSQKEPAIP